MRVICSWCKERLPDKEPFDDTRISHSMCDLCFNESVLEGDELDDDQVETAEIVAQLTPEEVERSES